LRSASSRSEDVKDEVLLVGLGFDVEAGFFFDIALATWREDFLFSLGVSRGDSSLFRGSAARS
jgi:hypothetical protein